MREENGGIYQADLSELRERHLGRLLLRAYRKFSSRAVQKLRSRGYRDIALAHTMLITNVDEDGIRITTLADKVGVTRQAAGALVSKLEKQGYVERTADPEDKRAFIVSLTDAGWKLTADIVEVKTEIETEYSDLIGKERISRLRRDLTDLLENVDKNKPR